MKILSIVIPAYNEAQTIVPLLEKVVAVPLIPSFQKEIIIVNDCSTDRTEELVGHFCRQHPGANIHYCRQEVNRGKGAAIHRGIALAQGDYILVQDADMEYSPAEYNILLQPVADGVADVVYGSRFMGGNPHRVLFFWHTVGNRFLTLLSNLCTNLNLTDMETCYKLVDASILKSITLCETRFGFEPEVTAKLARVPGIRIYEVGISYYGRTYREGKKIGWEDGFRAIYCILKYNIFTRRQHETR